VAHPVRDEGYRSPVAQVQGGKGVTVMPRAARDKMLSSTFCRLGRSASSRGASETRIRRLRTHCFCQAGPIWPFDFVPAHRWLASSIRLAARCLDIFHFEIRQFFQDLVGTQAGGKEIENVDDANAHAPNTWPAAALLSQTEPPLRAPSSNKNNTSPRKDQCTARTAPSEISPVGPFPLFPAILP